MRNALTLLYAFAEQMRCYGKLKQSWLSYPTWEDAVHTTSRCHFHESKRSMASDVKHRKKDTRHILPTPAGIFKIRYLLASWTQLGLWR
jgi:hypothetical protein